MKNNVKKAWWQKFIMESPYNVGVDCAILMNSQTWIASGHLGGFSDPLMDCKSCKERFRADKLIEDYKMCIRDRASSDLFMMPHYCVRECAAVLKDKLMGNM